MRENETFLSTTIKDVPGIRVLELHERIDASSQSLRLSFSALRRSAFLNHERRDGKDLNDFFY